MRIYGISKIYIMNILAFVNPIKLQTAHIKLLKKSVNTIFI